MCMIIKGITKDAFINILLEEYSFEVVHTVPFKSELGKAIIDKYGLEWLYNNRYYGVSALDCVCCYALRIASQSAGHNIVNDNMGIYGNPFNTLSMYQINANLDRHIDTLAYFEVDREIGYFNRHKNTDLLFDIIVSNDMAKVTNVYAKRAFKGKERSKFFTDWSKKEVVNSYTFLGCLMNYFHKVCKEKASERIKELNRK